ncbi:glycosyltransferase [Oceaniglobus roseus]|uniref:glycosyltransferase n=1 Tax=Oceaniglobus roseus TaxID=1737570 RepID=UPI000C7EF991|nr:glycosyltransferase [Kandeliimicrobium roseum]
MRILHVIASLDPRHGGPQCAIIHHAAAQSRLGAGVGIASYLDPAARARVAQEVALSRERSQVVIHTLPRERLLGRPLALSAAASLPALVERADWVHLHGIWEPVLIQAARIARARHVPYCITPHGMLDPWSLSQKWLKKRIALRATHRQMIAGARFLHTLNRDEEALIAPLGLNLPTVTVANGVNLGEIGAGAVRGRFRASLPALGDRPFVLFLSRLHRKKGLDVLAAAFARLARRRPGVDLVVIGPDGGAEHDFRARIAAAGLGRRVHLLGPVFGARKFQAMADCACFCLPSRQEGFSIAITEALACGAPVLISEGCHFPEVAAAGAGRVLPLSPEAFAAAMEAVLDDPAGAAALGAAGRQLVEQRYTWAITAAQMLEAYAAFGPGPAARVA